MKSPVFVFTLLLILHACKGPTTNFEKHEIVVVFKQNNLERYKDQGVFVPKLTAIYYSDQLIKKQHLIANAFENDTLKIPTSKTNLTIRIRKGFEYQDYFLQAGDSVVFTMDSGLAHLSKLNRKTKLYDLNISQIIQKSRNTYLKSKRNQQTKLSSPEWKEELQRSHHLSILQLDSLVDQNMLSKKIKDLLLDQIKAQLYTQSLLNKQNIPDQNVQDSIFAFANRGDLLAQPFFHDFLIWSYLTSNLMNVKVIRTPQSKTLDYKDAYDKTLSHFVDVEVQDWVLLQCLEMLQEEGSVDEFQTYRSRFQKDVQNTSYHEYLAEQYDRTPQELKGQSMLVNVRKEQSIEFQDLIDQYAGKIVYVDLWASWCVPCRAAMPASKKLTKEYKNKDIVFLYVSLDDKFTNWEQATQEERLFSNPHSFLLSSPKEAKILKELQVKTIPRYLLYGKNGKLIHQNAPGPDSDEIRNLLNQYLNTNF